MKISINAGLKKAVTGTKKFHQPSVALIPVLLLLPLVSAVNLHSLSDTLPPLSLRLVLSDDGLNYRVAGEQPNIAGRHITYLPDAAHPTLKLTSRSVPQVALATTAAATVKTQAAMPPLFSSRPVHRTPYPIIEPMIDSPIDPSGDRTADRARDWPSDRPSEQPSDRPADRAVDSPMEWSAKTSRPGFPHGSQIAQRQASKATLRRVQQKSDLKVNAQSAQAPLETPTADLANNAPLTTRPPVSLFDVIPKTSNVLDLHHTEISAAPQSETTSYAFTSTLEFAAVTNSALNFYKFSAAGLLEAWQKAISPAKPTVTLSALEPAELRTAKNLLLSSIRKPRYTIVLDPGHGGRDPGTIGPTGLLEKELTLDIAARVKRLASKTPEINVILTRNIDEGFTRGERLHSIKKDTPDLLLSLHFNNLPEKDLTVVETFYAGQENILESHLKSPLPHIGDALRTTRVTTALNKLGISEQAKNSRLLAGIVQRHMFGAVSNGNHLAVNNGIKKETLYILTRSGIPGALIEISCLSNSSEEKRLRSPAYRDQLAESLMNAITEYFRTQDAAQSV